MTPGEEARTGTSGTGDESPAKSNLVSILGLIAPLLTAMAALSLKGTVGRVQINHPFLFSVVLAFVVVAPALWVVRGVSDALGRAAVALAVLGVWAALALTISTQHLQPRARIDAHLNPDRTMLIGSVHASNLKTEDRVAIFVDGLSLSKDGSYVSTGHLFQDFVGPDDDNAVTQDLSVSLKGVAPDAVGVKVFTGRTSNACDAPDTVTNRLSNGAACAIVSVKRATQ